MQVRHPFIFSLFLFLQIVPARGQSPSLDSVQTLRVVVVEAPRISGFSPGLKTTLVDSLTKIEYRQKNLSDLLANESPIFIKSYGLGSLATTAFRGGSAYHTAVLWNGFSLSSPLNGQLDLSLVPMGAADEINIQYGGSSALFGSGSVSGAVHLTSNPTLNNGVSARVNLMAGSFSDYRQEVHAAFSKEKFVASVKIFNATAKNDFLYSNPFSETGEELRQTHARLENRGIISENKFLIGKSQILKINAWLQHTDRDLPPTLLQRQSRANQTDDALRLNSEWILEKGKATTFVRAAWLHDKLVYSDELSVLDETSLADQIIAEAETKINLTPRHFINLGLHNTFSKASHESFNGDPRQNRFAIFASYLFTTQDQKLSASLSARQEWVDESQVPFTWSVGGSYAPAKWISLRANASRVYRIPTFNDLYWVPGGNPDLKPEDGYSQEAGAKITVGNETFQIQLDLTAYNRNIENWIMWLPDISYWIPQNIMDVWSRGVETNSSLGFSIGKARVSLSVLTNYVLSSNQVAKTENDLSVDRQLIYTPMYSGMGKATLQYHRFLLSYRHNYVGYRYTSTDNTQYLSPFDLGSAYVSYRLPMKKSELSLWFNVNNIWNETYQVVANRVMPGLNFNSGISFQFTQKSNNELLKSTK